MRMQRKHKGTSQLYLYDHYNLHGIFPGNFYAVRNPFLRVINTVIYGLNKFEKLPRFMIIVADKELVEFIGGNKKGDNLIIGMMLEWLIKQIEKAVDRKKNMMRELKPGSTSVCEPKFVRVKMMKGPWDGNYENLFEKRKLFNEILEEVLSSRRDSYIMNGDIYLDRLHFNRLFDLTVTGREEFWKAVDDQIKKFDKQQLTLKPQAPKK